MRGRKYKLSDAGSDSEILQTLCEEGEEKEVFFNHPRKPQGGCTTAEKQLSVLIIILIIVIIVISGLLIWQHYRIDELQRPCQSASCVRASGGMIKKMNFSADPCVDFYEYACGNWKKSTIIPPSKAKWGAFSEVYEKNMASTYHLLTTPGSLYQGQNSSAILKSKDYFKACMNVSARETRGTGQLFTLLKFLGSCTIFQSPAMPWDPANWDFLRSLALVHRQQLSVFFSMSVSVDDKHTDKYIIRFSQSGLNLRDRDQYVGNKSEKYHKAYVHYITSVAKLLGGGNDTQEKAERIWELEKKIANITYPREELTDPSKIYHKMTVKDVQTLFGDSIDLARYLKLMFNTTIPDTESVLVSTPDFFSGLKTILKETNKEDLANYMMWSTANSLLGTLPQAFELAAIEMNRVLTGVATSSPLWISCVGSTDKTLGFATGALFVLENYAQENQKYTKGILALVKQAFIANLPRVSWMDRVTQKRAIEKAKAILDNIGYPDWILDPKLLDEHYANLKISDSNSFYNAIQSRDFYSQRNLKRRGTTPDKKEWHMTPSEVNAYYSPSSNMIVFPAGILQEPFFSPEFPASVNFGTLGFVMGHELTHGFDNMGRQYDKFGNLHNWWKNESIKAFKERSKCIENQYSEYKIGGKHVNGLTTLGENIADNGGLKNSLRAYKAWRKANRWTDLLLPGLNMTDNQQFFLGSAQVWCSYYTPTYAKLALITDEHGPPKYRVIGTLSNMEEFSEAYQCPRGSPMNPDKKCVVW